MNLFVPFVMGLLSSTHCLSMCGPIASTLTFSLTQKVRVEVRYLLPYLLAYNFGRILIYAVMGTFFGALGAFFFKVLPLGHLLLQGICIILIVGTGLYLGDWFPDFARIEMISIFLWRRLEIYGRNLLPVDSIFQALVFGMFWGWLPCSLIYSVLALATVSGGPIEGLLVMVSFGAGTLPIVAGAGLLPKKLPEVSKCLRYFPIKQFVAVSFVVFGCLEFFHLLISFKNFAD
ncbi:Sulfite exporter TauE/SafE family protein [Gammaproteobacteria bacterium]